MWLFLAFIFCLFFPTDALAWGPGVHMAIGHYALEHLHSVAPSVAAALSLHPGQFLYGCLSADIFIGKGCRFTPTHSHNWDTGQALLRQAGTPEATAYAYGYLSHLAADVIAHNYLVPNMLGFSAGHGKLSHTYVEMLADLRVNSPQASPLFRAPHGPEDAMLRTAVAQKKMPFLLKKHLFHQSLRLVEKKSYRFSLGMLHRGLPGRKETLILESIGFARKLVMDFLRDPRRSPALECDPIGSANLDRALSFRKRQRGYYLRHGQGIIFPLDPRLETCLHPTGGPHEHFS